MNNAPGHQPAPPPRPSWWTRNWKWFVPTIVILPGLLMVTCCGGAFWGILGVIKSTTPYQQSLTIVQNDPDVIAAIGQPIEPGWMVQGEVNTTGSSGNADLSYTVSGPAGSAHVHVIASRAAGVWTFDRLIITLPDDTRLDRSGGPTPEP